MPARAIAEELESAAEVAQASATARVERAADLVQADQTVSEGGTSLGVAAEIVTPLEGAREVRRVITGRALAQAAVAALRAWALEEAADAAVVAGADKHGSFRRIFKTRK